MSPYSCQLWDLNSANIQLFYAAWRRCVRRIFHLHPRTHNKLLPAICQNDIRRVLCDRIQSFLGKVEASGNILRKFCSLFVNRGSGSSVCNSKNMCLCTRTNHNCDETTLRLGGLILDFISYRYDVPHDDNLKILDFYVQSDGSFTLKCASLYIFARVTICSSLYICNFCQNVPRIRNKDDDY